MRIPAFLVYAVLIALISVSFLSGYYLHGYYLHEELSARASELEIIRAENLKLKAEVKDLRARVMELESEGSKLRAEGEALKLKISELISKLQEKEAKLMALKSSYEERGEDLSELEERLKKVRKVLEILREDKELLAISATSPPENRTEAKRYWNDTKRAIERIEPNLLPSIERIIHYLDYYFDWLEAAPPPNATMEQVCEWIFMAPEEARRYSDAIDTFRNEIYQVLISDIGEVLIVLEELT